ncbi:MAG: hypothetical protein ACI841_003558, partial [Planctomycetota bacterium]
MGDKGLTIVGVTSEGSGMTEKWIEKNGAEFAYAYDKGSKLSRFFGVGGIPHAILVDANGTVIWRGHPGSLKDATVSKALEGTIPTPLWEFPSEAKDVAKALSSRKFAKALEAANKMGESGQGYADIVNALANGRVALMSSAQEEGDWLTIDDKGKDIAGMLKGMEQAGEVEVILAALKGDKEAQGILKAQKKVKKILSAKIKKKEIPAIKDKLKKISKDFPGTAVERDVIK